MDQEEVQTKLEEDIEEIELHDKSTAEIKEVINGLSAEAMTLRRNRKRIRYQLYRLKAEAEGICGNVSEEGFKELFEEQPFFDKWRNFSISWDVAMDEPMRIVHRYHSMADEWDEVIKSKFPSVAPGGKITYPDITVRRKVEAEAKLQEDAKKK